MPPKDAITTVLNRNNFYRDGYRLLLKISLVQAMIIVLMVVGIGIMVTSMKTRSVYFATTSDGRIINIVPLNEPYLSPAQVIAWTASHAQNVMRFGYSDYRERLQQASDVFTTTGWASFNKALKDSGFLDAVTAHKQVVALDINGAPQIDQTFVRNGVYTWFVHMPITFRFDGDQASQSISTVLRLQIVRVSTLQNPDGISIEQWIPGTNPSAGKP